MMSHRGNVFIDALTADTPSELDANISPGTRVHARVTFGRPNPWACGALVIARILPCPRVPALFQDGKEGVDGSSPSEGSRKPLLIRPFY